MPTPPREGRGIEAKIVYFGAAGAGKSSNLRLIQQKLKKAHRGKLRTLAASSAGGSYEVLPVELGSVRGFATSIQIHTVPNGAEHRAARRQILVGAHGIVFVADLRAERHQATAEALVELREHLYAHGRELDDVVLVIQYNHRDEADQSQLDTLHRRLGVSPDACFEAVASKGTGVLQTLTTVSKRMLAGMRDTASAQRGAAAGPPEPDRAARHKPRLTPPAPAPAPARAEAAADPGKGFRIESAGPASGTDDGIRLPICLVDEASGRRIELEVEVRIRS